jgi:histidine ammonia-lyase
MVNTIELKGNDLTIEDVINIAENYFKVELSAEAKNKIVEGRKKLDAQMKNHPEIPIYGTNCIHGDLKDVQVKYELLETYQQKYIKVHNCGTGNPLPVEIVRAIMVIRLNSFAKGMSGMQIETCQLLVDMLNKKVTPQVLEEGSVGASGDLVPLAMIGATMIGLPEAIAYFDGNEIPATEAFTKAGLKHITLGTKEAMGLTNGSNFIAAMAIFGVHKAEKLLRTANIATALSLEAIRGEKRAFGELISEKANRHKGQIAVAQEIRNLIKDSQRCTKECQESTEKNGKRDNERVQDRYSFRCVPQVHCALWNAINELKSILETEINSATDNPLFDFNNIDETTGGIVFASGGNFHGQPLASPVDYLKMTLTSLGLISDRRAFSLLDDALSYGLPADLAKDIKQADSGYMIAQYAGAARCAENKVLSAPASVMSIPTSANQEDHVSMGSVGVVHLHKIIHNIEVILAIELLCATRALQLVEDGTTKINAAQFPLASQTQEIYNKLKVILSNYREDNYLKTEIDKIVKFVKMEIC